MRSNTNSGLPKGSRDSDGSSDRQNPDQIPVQYEEEEEREEGEVSPPSSPPLTPMDVNGEEYQGGPEPVSAPRFQSVGQSSQGFPMYLPYRPRTIVPCLLEPAESYHPKGPESALRPSSPTVSPVSEGFEPSRPYRTRLALPPWLRPVEEEESSDQEDVDSPQVSPLTSPGPASEGRLPLDYHRRRAALPACLRTAEAPAGTSVEQLRRHPLPPSLLPQQPTSSNDRAMSSNARAMAQNRGTNAEWPFPYSNLHRFEGDGWAAVEHPSSALAQGWARNLPPPPNVADPVARVLTDPFSHLRNPRRMFIVRRS